MASGVQLFSAIVGGRTKRRIRSQDAKNHASPEKEGQLGELLCRKETEQSLIEMIMVGVGSIQERGMIRCLHNLRPNLDLKSL